MSSLALDWKACKIYSESSEMHEGLLRELYSFVHFFSCLPLHVMVSFPTYGRSVRRAVWQTGGNESHFKRHPETLTTPAEPCPDSTCLPAHVDLFHATAGPGSDGHRPTCHKLFYCLHFCFNISFTKIISKLLNINWCTLKCNTSNIYNANITSANTIIF